MVLRPGCWKPSELEIQWYVTCIVFRIVSGESFESTERGIFVCTNLVALAA